MASAAGRKVGWVLVKKDTPFAYKSPLLLFLFSVIALSMSAYLQAYAGGGDGERGASQVALFTGPRSSLFGVSVLS